MTKLNKGYRIFERAIIIFSLFLYLQIGLATIYNTIVIPISPKPSILVTGFVSAFIFSLMCIAVYVVFKRFDTINDNKHFIIAGIMLCFMTFIHMFLIFLTDVRPNTDSFDDIDEAMYLTNHKEVLEDNAHAGFMKAFGNNYFFIIILKWFFSFLKLFGIKDILTPLYTLNVLLIILATFLSWLLMKEVFGIKQANKLLFLLMINPVYYAATFWAYTATMSVWITMLIAYLSLKIYRNRNIKENVIYGIFVGILVGVGFKLRPTSIFVFIAVVLMTVGYPAIKNNIKKLLCVAISGIIACVLVISSFGMIEDKYFGKVSEYNNPITYWLCMGSHGNGNISTAEEDRQYLSTLDKDEKMGKMLKRTINNYLDAGVVGTAKLFHKKMSETFANGDSGMGVRINIGQPNKYVDNIFAGKYRFIYMVYAGVFRLLTIVGMIAIAVKMLFIKDNRRLNMLAVITVLGGIVFYWIWESKNAYSSPFIPMMLLVSTGGIDVCIVKSEKILKKKCLFRTLVVLLCAATILFDYVMIAKMHKKKETFSRVISSVGNVRANVPIEFENNKEIIIQDFYTKRKFNRILLVFDKNRLNGKRVSYEFTLLDDDNNVIDKRTKRIFSKKNKYLELDFESKKGNEHYYLKIRKKTKFKNGINFYTKNNYYLDSYDGKLVVNNNDNYVNDLMMNVIYVENDYYISIGAITVICILVWMFVIVCIYNVRKLLL